MVTARLEIIGKNCLVGVDIVIEIATLSVIVDESRDVKIHLLRNVFLIEQAECVNAALVKEHLRIFARSVETISISHLQHSH